MLIFFVLALDAYSAYVFCTCIGYLQLLISFVYVFYSGYMAPEYATHGQFSVKSDVFSFGMLVLEMVTGQKNQCFRDGENIEHLLSFVSIHSSNLSL